MPMDRKVALLIALLAREYRGNAVNALAALDELGDEELSEKELAGLTPAMAAQMRDLKATRKGIENAIEIVDEGVSALDRLTP